MSCCGHHRDPGSPPALRSRNQTDCCAADSSDSPGSRYHPRELSASSLKKLKAEPCMALVPLLVTTLIATPRYDPYSADVLPGLDLNLFDRIGNRPHAGRGKKVGRGIDAVERQAVLNLPLTGASEAQTDIAVDAREHAGRRGREIPDVRPFSGSSTIARLPIVSETVALSVVEDLRPGFDIHRFGEVADLEHRDRCARPGCWSLRRRWP